MGIEIINDRKYEVENGIYTPVEAKNVFEKMGGKYIIEIIEDDLEILVPYSEEEENEYINIYGEARKKYLQENKKWMNEKEIKEDVKETQERVKNFFDLEIPRMKKSWGITEELKEKDQMKWVKQMENINATLREIVYKEIIYV